MKSFSRETPTSCFSQFLADQLPNQRKWIIIALWSQCSQMIRDFLWNFYVTQKSRWRWKWYGFFSERNSFEDLFLPNLTWSKYVFASFGWAKYCLHQANQPQPRSASWFPNSGCFFSTITITCRCFKWWWMVTMVNTSNPSCFSDISSGSNSDHLGCGGFRAAFQVTWTAARASVCHMRPVSGVQDIGDQGNWTCWTPFKYYWKRKEKSSCRKISIWTLTTGNHLSDAVVLLLRELDSLWNPCMTLGRW